MREAVLGRSVCLQETGDLHWDPMTTLYEEQEAAMIDYSGHVVTTTQPLMGHVNHLVINLLSSLTTDQAYATNDECW